MLNNAWEISNVEIIMQARNLKVKEIPYYPEENYKTAVSGISVICDGIKGTVSRDYSMVFFGSMHRKNSFNISAEGF